MRQRKTRNLEEKLEALSGYIIDDPAGLRGRWRSIYKNGTKESPFCLEIGCGKGKFLTETAKAHPDWLLLAIEGQPSVALHALQRIDAEGVENIFLVLKYLRGIRSLFADGEIDRLYLNFSDPWPKLKHEKRRLTNGKRLLDYAKIIKKGGFIEFKTDNDGLFFYSVKQIEKCPVLETVFITRDLHSDVPLSEIITTEYEDKFSARGKNINYISAKVL